LILTSNSRQNYKQGAARRLNDLCGCVFLLAAMSMIGCKAANLPELTVLDDRYDLIALSMAPILTSDARECASLISKARGQKVDNKYLQAASELAVDYWHVVERDILSDADVGDVLPYGGDTTSVKSILQKGGAGLVEKNAELCGEYAGAVVVAIGTLSLRDSIEMAEGVQPGMFEEMGLTLEQVYAGVDQIGTQVDGLKSAPLSDRIDCMVLSHVSKQNDIQMQSMAAIWTAALTESIESGALDETKIRQQSSYWREFVANGREGVLALDGVSEKGEACNQLMFDAATQVAQ